MIKDTRQANISFTITVARPDDTVPVYLRGWGMLRVVAEFPTTVDTYRDDWQQKVQPMLDNELGYTVLLLSREEVTPVRERRIVEDEKGRLVPEREEKRKGRSEDDRT